MPRAANEETGINESTSDSGQPVVDVSSVSPAPPDESSPSLTEEEVPIDADTDDSGRPAGEAGLFGDPRPNVAVDDEQDREPEIVRS